MEKVAIAKSRSATETIINITRYGNVMCSRGSVIPLFTKQLMEGVPLTITDPSMTRFMMSLDDAVNLVLHAFENGCSGETFVQKAPAATIETLASALITTLNIKNPDIKLIGSRHGEKLYETLLSSEEMFNSEDQGEYYCIIPDKRNLNYSKYVEKGNNELYNSIEYNSHNTHRLSIEEMVKVLSKLNFIKALQSGIEVDPED
jgi:UDP-N-acetylglucosamine 4,6-dehydratase/5-epimerase